MGFYTAIYLRASRLHPDYRAAISKALAVERECTMSSWSGNERTESLRPKLIGPLFEHPFFDDERWHSLLTVGDAKVEGERAMAEAMRVEGVQLGQSTADLREPGSEPELGIAAEINHGHDTIGLFLHWVCCGILGVKTWITNENAIYAEPYFSFGGETLLPSDLLAIKTLSARPTIQS